MVKKYVCIPRSFLVINLCNQGKTFMLTLYHPRKWGKEEVLMNGTYMPFFSPLFAFSLKAESESSMKI